LIVVAVSSDRNIIKQEVENKLEYKNWIIQIQRMRNMKCFVALVATGATGIVT
jgi:hypothetical protein